MKLRPRIRTILLGVNLIILMLPVAGIAFLRIYDNELVRQTEVALTAQGAVLQSTYKNVLLQELHENHEFDEYGLPREVFWPEEWDEELGRFPANLDVTSGTLRPQAEEAPPAPQPSDRYASSAGELLHPILTDAQEVSEAQIRIVDWRGTIVGSTVQDTGRSLGDRHEVRRALKGEVVSVLRADEESRRVSFWESLTRRARVAVYVAVPIVWEDRVYGAVLLSRTPVSLGKALYRNRDVFLGLFALLLIGVSMITLLTTFTIQRPLRQLNRQTRRIAATGGATRPIENPGTLEFEELSLAIATMAKTLEERNEYIRTFARNVSHEFKTPLASIKGTVELLEDHFNTMPEEKRRQFLSMIMKDNERLDRLVRRLLELARADVFNPTTESVDAVEFIEELAERSRIDVTIDLGGNAALPVAMSPDAFESVFTNLFDNAARHGGGIVGVEVVESTSDHFEVLVQDDGPGISEANREKIFESFFTTAREEGGTGLGLPIVRAMLLRHGGDIRLIRSETGAAFLVSLPRSTPSALS